MSDLTDKAAVKEYLGITHSDWDDLIDSLITRMSAFIETYCDRTFAEATYTDERYDGNPDNGGLLLLDQLPVTSVTSLYDDLGYDFDTPIPSTDYLIYEDEGIIQLKQGVLLNTTRNQSNEFNEGHQNIKITYVAGYATTPADVEQATIELVSLKLNARGHEGIKSERLGRWAISYVATAVGQIPMTASIQATLDRYKKRQVFMI